MWRNPYLTQTVTVVYIRKVQIETERTTYKEHYIKAHVFLDKKKKKRKEKIFLSLLANR